MARCLISFGANIGNSLETIQLAASLLRAKLRCEPADFEFSRCFRTPPVGGPTGQPPFVNAVAAARTRLTVWDVWRAIQAVEQELGRQRNRRWEARRIDLDILLYEDERIWSESLKVPHPRMCMRRFILLPALDVAADWIDPVSGQSVSELAQRLQTGAGSLLLVSLDSQSRNDLMTQVADLSGALLLQNVREVLAQASKVRWVAEMQSEDLDLAVVKAAKLVMFTAADQRLSSIQLRKIEKNLGLRSSDSQEHAGILSAAFPRYLLISQDLNWVIHEMVSALEAMDCPVEPIAELA